MSDSLTRRGKLWHYDFHHQGKRHRGSTKQSDKKLAQAVVNQLRSRLDRVAVFGAEAELTLAEAARLYLAKNNHDVKLVERMVAHFGKDRRIASIRATDITDAAWQIYPRARPATRNRNVIAPMSAIINHAADRGLAHAIRCKRFAVEIAPKQAGSKPWLQGFQDQARRMGHDRLAALARFMFETAARISQGVDLRWQDVNLSEGYVDLKTRKTGANGAEFKHRRAWLTPAMVAEFANLPRDPLQGETARVFAYASRHGVRTTWKSVIKAAKLPYMSRHQQGRHGFFTETIVRQGMDVVTASDMGGITPALATQRYAHAEAQRAKFLKAFGEKA